MNVLFMKVKVFLLNSDKKLLKLLFLFPRSACGSGGTSAK